VGGVEPDRHGDWAGGTGRRISSRMGERLAPLSCFAQALETSNWHRCGAMEPQCGVRTRGAGQPDALVHYPSSPSVRCLTGLQGWIGAYWGT
jgi:hypothetical protein